MREEFSKMFLSIFFLIFILFIRQVFIIKLMPFWTLSEKVTLWHVFDHIVTISKSCDLYSFGVCSVVLPCRVRPMAILIILYSICFRIPTLCFFVRCSKFKSSFFFYLHRFCLIIYCNVLLKCWEEGSSYFYLLLLDVYGPGKF